MKMDRIGGSGLATTFQQPRLWYYDNLRTFLTALLILHHTSIAYGGSGNWKYRSPYHASQSIPLVAFNAINQSFFMGTFFFLSGYFSAISKSGKSKGQFIMSKVVRLLIPTIVYTLVMEPTIVYILRIHYGDLEASRVFMERWRELRGVEGPVWYCALLFIFDICFTLVARENNSKPATSFIKQDTNVISYFDIYLAFIIDILACVFIRLYYPTGTVFPLLNVQLGYSPQYLLAYCAGHILVSSPPSSIHKIQKASIPFFIATNAIFIPPLLVKIINHPSILNVEAFSGGLTLPSIAYAAYNEVTFLLLSSTLLIVFKKYFNSKWWNLGRYSYASFLVHPLTLVALHIVFEEWKAGAILKTSVVGSIGIVLSWGLGWILLKVPMIDWVV